MTGTIDEDETDSFEFKRPAGPSPREVRAGWARDGDVDALWGLLTRSNWDAIDQEDVFQLLIRALEVQSRDPERFAADVFARMTIFTTALLLRCHLHASSYIAQSGRAVRMRAQPPGDLPKVAVEVLIPRIVQLQEHVSGLLLSQASVARQWALVRRNKGRGPEAAAVTPKAAKDKKQANKGLGLGTGGRENGKANQRLAALLNGHGPGTNGAQHDD